MYDKKKTTKINRSNSLQGKLDLDLQHQQNYYEFALNVKRHTVGQIPKKCKETSNLMQLSLIWSILVLFAC